MSIFAVFTIVFFTSGMLWPVEGMPRTVQRILSFNPLTLPIITMRNIMLRGWSLQHGWPVIAGFVYNASLSFVCIVFQYIVFNLKNWTLIIHIIFLKNNCSFPSQNCETKIGLLFIINTSLLKRDVPPCLESLAMNTVEWCKQTEQ